MDTFVIREGSYLCLELCLSDVFIVSIQSETHPYFTCTPLFHTDIDFTRRILAHEYHREYRSVTDRRKCDLIADIVEDGGCDETSVEEHEDKNKNTHLGYAKV
jgi:hypothetical protein